MNTFFEDDFINKKMLSRLVREVKKEQLKKTINEINYLNEIQSHLVGKNEDILKNRVNHNEPSRANL